MPKENDETTFEGRDPPTLFRGSAAECLELAQTTPTPEKRQLYLKMASVWHQMAQRWEKKVSRGGDGRPTRGAADFGEYRDVNRKY